MRAKGSGDDCQSSPFYLHITWALRYLKARQNSVCKVVVKMIMFLSWLKDQHIGSDVEVKTIFGELEPSGWSTFFLIIVEYIDLLIVLNIEVPPVVIIKLYLEVSHPWRQLTSSEGWVFGCVRNHKHLSGWIDQQIVIQSLNFEIFILFSHREQKLGVDLTLSVQKDEIVFVSGESVQLLRKWERVFKV